MKQETISALATLKEYAEIKMANINSKRRPDAKEAREAAREILPIFNDLTALKKYHKAHSENPVQPGTRMEKVMEALESRIKELTDEAAAKKKAEAEIKAASAPVHKTVEFIPAPEVGQHPMTYHIRKAAVECCEIKDAKKMRDAITELLVSSGKFSNKDLERCVDKAVVLIQKGRVAAEKANGKSAGKGDSKTATARSAKKAGKGASSTGKMSYGAHKVGDRHPKHPEWEWTEYQPGKFDWRIRRNK